MSIQPQQRRRLEETLERVLRADVVIIDTIEPLRGGAIQENWSVAGRADGHTFELVVRKDATSKIRSSHTRQQEFSLLKAAHDAGITVPRPISFEDDTTVLGAPFAIIAKVPGVGFGPRVVRDPSLGGDRTALAERLGRELAQIHAISPGEKAALSFLGEPSGDPVQAEIDGLRNALDSLAQPRPALEWGLRWAEVSKPAADRLTLCHRDFRTGNYLVDASGLTAILDWEFAGWGDAMSDLGWFCAACWRFGRPDLEAGGIASREAFYRGYEMAAGCAVDDERVRFWEVMAHIRWGVVALEQGDRHFSGREFSLELALTARMIAELELAVLRATAPSRWKLAHAGR